ncbi:MAG: FAD-binding protein [Candidatus Zixiibacteriota bacterium]
MKELKIFISVIESEFPKDRLTWQKGVATFHPETTDEAARLFKLANLHKQKLYVTGFGNNIVPVGERFEKLIAVKSDRLNHLYKIVSGDLYIEVGAGYPIREINLHLEKEGLFLPHGELPYVGSVGGALATGLSMTRNDDPHPVPLSRFFLKGAIATPDGETITPGSTCFKSVSGFDIVKIFSPSWGLLGMIATAFLRVLPVSAKEEWRNLVQQEIDYESFSGQYKNPEGNQSAVYSIKIKNKFDPNEILPLID